MQYIAALCILLLQLMTQRYRRVLSNSGSVLLGNAGANKSTHAPNSPKAASDSELMYVPVCSAMNQHALFCLQYLNKDQEST